MKKVLTQSAVVTNNIQNQPNQVKDNATALKLSFDQTGIDAKTYNNTTLLTELQSEEANNAGANAIGAEGTFGTDNVGDELKAAKAEIVGITLGEIPDNTLTEAKMATEMKKGADGVAPYNEVLVSDSEDIVITSATTVVTQTVITGQSKPTFKGLSVVNSAKNGSLNNGTDDWVAYVGSGLAINGDYIESNMDSSSSALGQNLNIVSGHEYFLRAIAKMETSAVVDANFVIAEVGVISSVGVVLEINTTDTEVSDTITGITDRDLFGLGRTSITGQKLLIKKNSFYIIDKTALGMELFTESQMLDLVRAGYFEGIKNYSEVIESVGKNKVDISHIDTPDGFYNTLGVFNPNTLWDVYSNKVIEGDSYTKSGDIDVTNTFWNGDIFISGENSLTSIVPIGANVMKYAVTKTNKYNGNQQVENGLAATTYESYKKSTQRISGSRMPNGSADTESSNNNKTILLKSSDIVALTTSPTNVDYVDILKPLDSKMHGNTTSFAVDANALHEDFFPGTYADLETKIGTMFIQNTVKFSVIVKKGEYASVEEAQDGLEGTELGYQRAVSLPRTDSEVLMVYKDGSIEISYAPTELTLLEASNNASQTREGNAEAIGSITNRLQSVINNYTIRADRWIDDTANDDMPFWYNEIKIDCTGDDPPFFSINARQKLNGFADDLTNDIESFDNYVRIYATAQPSKNLTATVGVR